MKKIIISMMVLLFALSGNAFAKKPYEKPTFQLDQYIIKVGRPGAIYIAHKDGTRLAVIGDHVRVKTYNKNHEGHSGLSFAIDKGKKKRTLEFKVNGKVALKWNGKFIGSAQAWFYQVFDVNSKRVKIYISKPGKPSIAINVAEFEKKIKKAVAKAQKKNKVKVAKKTVSSTATTSFPTLGDGGSNSVFDTDQSIIDGVLDVPAAEIEATEVVDATSKLNDVIDAVSAPQISDEVSTSISEAAREASEAIAEAAENAAKVEAEVEAAKAVATETVEQAVSEKIAEDAADKAAREAIAEGVTDTLLGAITEQETQKATQEVTSSTIDQVTAGVTEQVAEAAAEKEVKATVSAGVTGVTSNVGSKFGRNK